MSVLVREAIAAHRPELLRHCYRMMGSLEDAEDLVQEALARAWSGRESFAGTGPVRHWLFGIATHACLNALKRKRRFGLPQWDRAPAAAGAALPEPIEPAAWIAPAPDERLFSTGPVEATERRESIALAFVALLQKLPPRQRAVLLLKEVVGWSAVEIGKALRMSVPAVNSALHRARGSMPADLPSLTASEEPSADVIRAYVRCWEARDIDGLLELLRDDVAFDMPPWAVWFKGRRAVKLFLESPRFVALHSRGFRLLPTRANGQIAFAFFKRSEQTGYVRQSIQLPRFEHGLVAAVTTFVGGSYLRGFSVPERIEDATERFSGSGLS